MLVFNFFARADMVKLKSQESKAMLALSMTHVKFKIKNVTRITVSLSLLCFCMKILLRN